MLLRLVYYGIKRKYHALCSYDEVGDYPVNYKLNVLF